MAAQIRSYIGQVTIGKLALFRIEQLELQLPSLAAQDQYLSELRSIELAQINVQEMAFDELFASLQSRAFSGQL